MSAAITVLNVDDQESARYALSHVLRRRGFVVKEAASGEEALRIVKSERPNLVLLDINLPDISGLEVCRRIKSDPETSSIPILHISATSRGREAKLKGFENGADAYLAADEDPEIVAATIRAVLRGHRAADSRPAPESSRADGAVFPSDERNQFPLEVAGVGAWDWDLCTNEVRWSANMETVHGQPSGSFGRTFQAFLDGVVAEDRPFVLDAIQRAILSGGEYRTEYRNLRADGRPSWMEAKGRVLYGDDGRPVRMSGICMDISERKQLEEQLQASAKLESLGVLAGGIAHDFNNLLVGILGNASLALEDAPAAGPLRSLLEGVIQAGERAAHLTEQMLAYAGKGRFFIQPVNLSDLVRSLLPTLESAIPPQVQLSVELAPDLAPVDADIAQMQQLLKNLVHNSVEAMGSRPGTITITTESRWIISGQPRPASMIGEIAPGRAVVLEVRDTGCGIDEATRARIFDPFFTTKFTGRGLGLAAVLGIVRSHNGAIEVESVPGRGSAFRALMPAGVEATPRRRMGLPERLTGHGTILIVDDEEIVRRLAQLALERYGYQVLVAESGRAGIEVFRERAGEISLVLLDLSMPGMSGEETLRELRSIHPGVPVVLSSGFSEADATRRFHGHELSGFLQKPYTATQVAEKVKSALPGRFCAGGA